MPFRREVSIPLPYSLDFRSSDKQIPVSRLMLDLTLKNMLTMIIIYLVRINSASPMQAQESEN